MKFVIQRVMESEVKVEGETLGKIGKGFMVLIGVSNSDTKEIADRMVKKMLGLRILRMNRERQTCLWMQWEEAFF